jgi:S-DNA-T family DNA segregation ATPase FtsK/SpoIIIE
MPHLLIAGATGSGKSVCINTIITSLLLRTTPDEVRLVMIDPKRIELAGYEGIPHLIQNVVTENEDALAALNWGVSEMERRYELLQKYNVRNIDSYNKKIKKLKVEEPELEDDEIPYIVIIVDEFADLIMTIGRDVEVPISRMAQMARAIGIHLIIATQRPSTKVITGIIKANFPARIAFQVASKIDSRVILDANGAEKLLGRGDSFFLPPGTGIAQRIHGAFIPDEEIVDVVAYLRTQPKPKFEIKIIEDEITEMGSYDYDDELFPQAAVAVVSAGNASVSMLQRHFKIGYARAGRLVDMLEQAGIIGPHLGSKSREVLASEEDLRIYGYLKN